MNNKQKSKKIKGKREVDTYHKFHLAVHVAEMVGAFSQHKQYSIIIRKAIHQNGEEPLPKLTAILPIILFFPLLAQIVCGHDQFFDRNHNVRFTVFAKGQFCGVLAAANNDALYTALSSFCLKDFHLCIPHIPIQAFFSWGASAICSPAQLGTIHIAGWFLW